jgi:N-dimethylarginine dimethylaminohydrolase
MPDVIAFGRAGRTARHRDYLMCRPTFFTVEYSINPWMDPAVAVDTALAVRQWEVLRETLLGLGHTVELIDPVPGLPDMVFAANGATVVDDRVLVATFRHRQRDSESAAYAAWFHARGYRDVQRAEQVNEGEGDHLVARGRILAANGFRTVRSSYPQTGAHLGRRVLGLTLIDPRFYHLDTALSVLDDEQIMYYPGAFSPHSRALLRQLFPTAIEADESDAAVLGLNVISDGRHVLLPAEATHLAARLAQAGYEPIGIELGELRKGGGGPKCCVLELRHAAAFGAMSREAAA